MTRTRAVVIAAPSSGSGKTLVTLGLLRALKDRGLRVASAKVGPDYIDPRFHEAATGRPCFNLDPWAMDHAQISALLRTLSQDADLIVIEGVMGLFDGPQGAKGSTADLAALLKLPVLLAVDCRHQAQSIAALVHGFESFRPDVTLAGVILNRVSSPRHEEILRAALPGKVAGTLRQNPAVTLPSRHLGLVQAEENQELETLLASAASTVSEGGLVESITRLAVEPALSPDGHPVLPPLGQRIAIARDVAFSFAYPHLLDGWRKAGAELSFFSPLANEAPAPDADAIFLPGGYPELHAGRLAASDAFLAGLRSSAALIYGECGGYMVLGETLTDADSTAHRMAGLLPLATSFAARKLHLGYRQLTPRSGSPWSGPLRAHEFHYSTLVSEGEADRLFDAADAAGTACPPMGLRRGHVMGSYAHIICEAR